MADAAVLRWFCHNLKLPEVKDVEASKTPRPLLSPSSSTLPPHTLQANSSAKSTTPFPLLLLPISILFCHHLSQLSSLHSTSITKLSHQVAAAAIAKRKATTSSTSQNKHHLSLAQLGSSACGLLTHISLVLHLASWLIPPH